MDNPTTKFALDHWYKVLAAGGLLLFVLTGAGLLKEFPTTATASIAAGAFFFGLGEWINHPLQTRLYRGGLRTTSHPRNASAMGIAFDALGALLAGIGLFKLLA